MCSSLAHVPAFHQLWCSVVWATFFCTIPLTNKQTWVSKKQAPLQPYEYFIQTALPNFKRIQQ